MIITQCHVKLSYNHICNVLSLVHLPSYCTTLICASQVHCFSIFVSQFPVEKPHILKPFPVASGK